jgi:putative salt-induced outer membrane protein YdiY
VAVAIAFLGLQPALADEVIMQNGDRMTGDVIRQDAGRLKLETAYAGTLDIDWEQVSEVRLDEPKDVLLDDERVLQVRAVSREDDRLTLLQEPPSEPMTVEPARVKVIEPEPWELGEGYRLNGRVAFALKNERGNTHKNEIDFDFQLDYRRLWHRFESWGELEYDTRSGSKTTDKWSLDNNYRRLFDGPWYGSAWLFFKHDRFQDLRLRFLTGPALGYTFDESPTRNLRAEAGVFHFRDDFYELDDESYWGPGWFIDYDQLVWQERLQPYHKQYGVAASDKTIWRSWTGVRVPLAGGFVGGLEYEIEYDSDPSFETKTTDTTLRLKLGYQW